MDVDAAVRNNAAWCDHVCREHGLRPRFDADAWVCAERTPDYYPDAITLQAEVDIDSLLARIDSGSGGSVKDSYAALDLHAHGFEVLFDATWIARAHVGASTAVPRWIHHHLDGVDLYRTGDVVGLANVTSTDWTDLLAEIEAHCPGVPLVGYEHGDPLEAALAAGFQPLGPLRVWLHE